MTLKCSLFRNIFIMFIYCNLINNSFDLELHQKMKDCTKLISYLENFYNNSIDSKQELTQNRDSRISIWIIYVCVSFKHDYFFRQFKFKIKNETKST